MPSPLKPLAFVGLLVALALTACRDHRGALPGGDPPLPPDTVNLGNLQCGPTPDSTSAAVARFLFGTDRDDPIPLIKPMQVLTRDNGDLVICDGGLARVLRWDAASASLVDLPLSPPPARPIAIADAPAGLLVVDAASRAVIVYQADGRQRTRLERPGQELDPAGAVVVQDQVWVTNTAGHSIERFDLASGKHLATIGQRGDRPGQFGLPLGLCTDHAGQVYVADMLNARVQVFTPAGKHVRTIGGPGDRPGAFGRPKDVAVAADGTLFVTDAAAQCVQVFSPRGQWLAALGRQQPALAVPFGVSVLTRMPGRAAAATDRAALYVLVAEQLADPGIRVFRWTPKSAPPTRTVVSGKVWPAENPHWRSTGCATCHAGTNAPTTAPVGNVDAACIRCHDGVAGPADPHPLRAVPTDGNIHVPDGWPLTDGRLGCLTCHDIARHCDPGVARPARNPAMLRTFTERPLDFCGSCHVESTFERWNPHDDADGCRACHTGPMRFGQASGDSKLFDPSARACLRCHVEHWDYAPGGHLGQAVPPDMLPRAGGQNAQSGAFGTPRLPLHGQRIACYTCHDPHPAGSAGRGPGLLADRLRVAQPQLCGQCHSSQ